MEEFCRSQSEALAELERTAPGAPFLALGQTVFWDEPLKAGVVQASRRLGYDRKFVSGIHDTDYFAKYAHSELKSGFAAMPHNDTTTKALWSAAGEFAALFGSETVVSRETLASAGGKVARVSRRRPGYLDEITEAWGWRGIVSYDRGLLTTAEKPMRRLFDTVYSTFEWAVAASLVAEVFPKHARAHASGIFHASSVLGTWMAAMVGMAVGAQWRYAYLIGIIPALLILWVRATVREPERWQAKKAEGASAQMGSFKDLLFNSNWNRHALLGMILAAVGLGTFWSVTIASQDLVRELLNNAGEDLASSEQKAKFAYGIIQTAGGGLGLLAFGPLCARFGRRRTFITIHLLAFLIVPVTCFGPQTYQQLLWLLPVFGFLTLGMHAGYAIYFPELFPTHLRVTGTSFCFNGGRVLAVPVLFFSAWLKAKEGVDLRVAVSALGVLFLLGAVVMLFLPETKDQDLPE